MAASKNVCFVGVLYMCVCGILGQFSIDHVGNVEDVVGDYRVQYHDEVGLLLIIHSLDCFVADLKRGTTLANKLEDPATRMDTQLAILALIEDGKITPTTLGDTMTIFHDTLLRALCFRSEMYTLDLSSLQ